MQAWPACALALAFYPSRSPLFLLALFPYYELLQTGEKVPFFYGLPINLPVVGNNALEVHKDLRGVGGQISVFSCVKKTNKGEALLSREYKKKHFIIAYKQ